VTLDIRPGSAADAPAIRRVRRESWIAAYTGIIDRAAIDRATAEPPHDRPAPVRRPGEGTFVAVGGDDPAVIGFASFGPEQAVASARHPAAAPPGAPAAMAGELYAIYVAPAWWSTGAGRSLMAAVLAALTEAGYRRVVLWVLVDNARARRFYERAGFAPDGVTNILTGLGGVTELRYARDL
jgi:ribosomal protein S18 acetylase RimI-like enzyme